MSQLYEALRHLRDLEVNPLGAVIAAALLAALIEQRMARRRTPDFSTAYRDISGKPQEPPPVAPRPKSEG